MTTPNRLFLPAATAIMLTIVAAVSFARGAGVGELSVSNAWARATPPGADVAAAYLHVENKGEDDRLMGVASPVARSVTLHETGEENGVATMRPLDAIVIPAGGALEMRPGGSHLMLSGLSAPLKAGEDIPLTLTFEKAGALDLTVKVMPIGADMDHDHAM